VINVLCLESLSAFANTFIITFDGLAELKKRMTELKRIEQDEQGLEGLPLQMLIIALVLSIGLPVVYSSIRYHDTQRVLKDLEEKAFFISEKARQIYLHGEGNSDVLDLQLENGMFREIEFLEITNATYKNQIQWRLRGGDGGRHFVRDDLPLISEETPLRLRRGEHRLSLECKFGTTSETDQEHLYVKVSKI